MTPAPASPFDQTDDDAAPIADDAAVVDLEEFGQDDGAHPYEMTFTERRERRGVDSMMSAIVDRLGLGNVDPLLVRIGALIAIGVLLVPLAMALRADAASDDTGRTTVTTVPTTATTVAPTIVPAPGAAAPIPAPVVEAVPTAEPLATAAAATAEAAATETTTAVAVDGPATADKVAVRLEPVCALVYTAHAGDYWLRLADAAGVSLQALLDANLATSKTPIYPGDEVCLPAGATLPSPPSPLTTAPPATTAPRPTTPPTTAAPTTTTSPPAPLTQDQVIQIIREVWPDDLEERALEIAYRESRYVPTAYNGWCCYGLFQIHWDAHDGWLDDFGITSPQQLYDARLNAQMALHIYMRAGGWGPWT